MGSLKVTGREMAYFTQLSLMVMLAYLHDQNQETGIDIHPASFPRFQQLRAHFRMLLCVIYQVWVAVQPPRLSSPVLSTCKTHLNVPHQPHLTNTSLYSISIVFSAKSVYKVM